ncbi:ArsA family ATPase [Picrophilus oshimae]|uniref:Putative arsenical pump-driving ATPase n=1 Tax=Picrophilus torridus (strain ATCC 700027 / DSM 9790 / JCM 10055 / NBRC 100828 / KAW 2/3) TaxID=1122961 RepID=A0A8G2L7M0_PICTO|nr:ArsA family ATPase [Picrophilus oshimae]SMD31150.1 arsenite efflux ATP-binding protein ArsA [Picrophilus oshimae DSM 9789]
MSRVILYTGKGGVGKTSVAAATAAMISKKRKTLVMSTDPAHSLSDSLKFDIGSEPTKIEKNLYAQEININQAINQHWEDLKEYLTALFQYQGIDPISADEIAILPGFEEATYLLYINDYIKEDSFDTIIVDSAPTGESLRLLSFPEVMTWYMDKIFPIGRTAAKIARPLVRPFTGGMPLPSDRVFKSAETLYKDLLNIQEIMQNSEITSIRLVTNADHMSFNETKRAYTYLLLYGYPVDAVIVNKIYRENTGDFFKAWRESQNEILNDINAAFGDIKIMRGYLMEREPLGVNELLKFGMELYDGEDPYNIFKHEKPYEFEKSGDNTILKVKLPFAEKGETNLFKKAGELIIEVKNWRRIVYLPQTISEKEPMGAEFKNGYLYITLS